jgi:hypothetical protein
MLALRLDSATQDFRAVCAIAEAVALGSAIGGPYPPGNWASCAPRHGGKTGAAAASRPAVAEADGDAAKQIVACNNGPR